MFFVGLIDWDRIHKGCDRPSENDDGKHRPAALLTTLPTQMPSTQHLEVPPRRTQKIRTAPQRRLFCSVVCTRSARPSKRPRM